MIFNIILCETDCFLRQGILTKSTNFLLGSIHGRLSAKEFLPGILKLQTVFKQFVIISIMSLEREEIRTSFLQFLDNSMKYLPD